MKVGVPDLTVVRAVTVVLRLEVDDLLLTMPGTRVGHGPKRPCCRTATMPLASLAGRPGCGKRPRARIAARPGAGATTERCRKYMTTLHRGVLFLEVRATLRRAVRKLWPFGRRADDDRLDDARGDDDGEGAFVRTGPPRRPRPSSAVALELPSEPVRTEARADEHVKGFLRRILGH